MFDIKNKRVLLCPLNWGLGHACRDIPVIESLISSNNEIILGGYGASGKLLKERFPKLKYLHFNSYSIRYSNSENQVFALLFQLPKIIYWILFEHFAVKKICRQQKIELIISDCRYGLWNKKVKSVFITHQLALKLPFSQGFLYTLANMVNRWLIAKFDATWVPDYIDMNNSLAGELSHPPYTIQKLTYLGILSRFNNKNRRNSRLKKEIDILFILSGPEPHRSIFEEIIKKELLKTGIIGVIVQGKVGKADQKSLGNTTIHSFKSDSELLDLVARSKYIICRSGYSSVMDIACLGVNALFVPTPGQTEQEYLAEYLFSKKAFPWCKQSEFKLDKILHQLEDWRFNSKQSKCN